MARRNLLAILASAGTGISELVHITAFLTSEANVLASRAIRDRQHAGLRPASTPLVVSAFANST